MTSAPRYEIFRKLLNQQPTWVETAASLDDAKERLKQLTVMFPGNYFIFDVENACFVIPYDREPAKPLVFRIINIFTNRQSRGILTASCRYPLLLHSD